MLSHHCRVYRLVTLISVVLLGMACGRNRTSTTSPLAASAPAGQKILLSDSMMCRGGADTIRFGFMHSGEIAVKPLVLHNRTNEPLLLTGTTQHCDCVALEFDPQPLRPDEQRIVRLRFDARGLTGWQFKTIDLHWAGKRHPLRLYVDVDVE